MASETWSGRLVETIEALEGGIRTLRACGAYSPSSDEGLPRLAEVWGMLTVDDGSETLAQRFRTAGGSLQSDADRLAENVVTTLKASIADCLTTASVAEIHEAGLVRTADFGEAVTIGKMVLGGNREVSVAYGQRDALRADHSLLAKLPLESCPGTPKLVVLGLSRGWMPEPFYGLRTTVAATKLARSSEIEREREARERHQRLFHDAEQREEQARRAAKARALAGEIGIDPDALATAWAGGAAE